jgi:cation diffusion facilitator family transporter
MSIIEINTESDDDSPIPPAERAAAASRSTWVSVVLSTTQIVVGVLSKSQGLIAHGVHSLSDLVADFVVLLANHASQKDADEHHPYGHHRFETVASLALGAMLLAVGAGMLWSRAVKLENPSSIAAMNALGSPAERAGAEQMLSVAAVGSPATVQKRLTEIISQTQADELIIASAVHDHAARKRSYELLAQLRD